jgi:hypothetical protein
MYYLDQVRSNVKSLPKNQQANSTNTLVRLLPTKAMPFKFVIHVLCHEGLHVLLGSSPFKRKITFKESNKQTLLTQFVRMCPHNNPTRVALKSVI